MSAESKRNKLFHAKIARGYVLKVLMESLGTFLTRTNFKITKKGLFHRNINDDKSVLFDVAFPRKNFTSYVCKKDMYFSINIKHMINILDGVKKKNTIIMYISEDKPDMMCISIRSSTPETSDKGISSGFVAIKDLNMDIKTDIVSLPTTVIHPSLEKPVEVYNIGKVVPSTEVQRIKNLIKNNTKFEISIQKDNYISFYADITGIRGSMIELGEIESDDDESDESDGESEESAEEEEEESAEEEEEETTDKNAEEEKKFYVQGMYKACFTKEVIEPILKLPGLCSHMQFYAPKVNGMPLKIEVDTGSLGIINVFIKDKAIIEAEVESKSS